MPTCWDGMPLTQRYQSAGQEETQRGRTRVALSSDSLSEGKSASMIVHQPSIAEVSLYAESDEENVGTD